LLRRQVPEAVTWLRKAAQENRRDAASLLFLASALAHAGQMDEARSTMRSVLELRPMESVRRRRQLRLHPEDDNEYVLNGARLAGLPE
jgi:cytochrome c-type biogenesis protein CcmH/NrfG